MAEPYFDKLEINVALARQIMERYPQVVARVLNEAVEQERQAEEAYKRAKEAHLLARQAYRHARKLKDSATTAATLVRGIMGFMDRDDPEIWSDDHTD